MTTLADRARGRAAEAMPYDVVLDHVACTRRTEADALSQKPDLAQAVDAALANVQQSVMSSAYKHRKGLGW